MEDKSMIVSRLCLCLISTRAGSDIDDLSYVKYDDGEEYVTIKFKSGGFRIVNVPGDSGAALILDVVKALL